MSSSAVARVATMTPERYIKQLCSHLARKRTTELVSAGEGVITFDTGRCVALRGWVMLLL